MDKWGRPSRTELKTYIRTYINKLLAEEPGDLKPFLIGVKRELRVKHSITENQWKVLVRFMERDSGGSKKDLRSNFDSIIGKDWRRVRNQNPSNTLEKFFKG